MPTLLPLYILHGWSVDEQNEGKWQPFRDALKKQGISTHFLQIPGLSSPLDEVWKLNNFIEWLHTQLPKNKKVILMGHSFGGQVATRYAAKYPDQVAQLILIDPAGVRSRSLKSRLKRSIFWVIAKVGKIFFRGEVFRKVLHKLARERDYLNASPTLRQTMANVISEEVIRDMSSVVAPTLIVWGSNDTATPVVHAQLFHDRIVGSELVMIEGARHSPHFTHVSQTAQAVSHFLKEKA